MTRRIAFLAAWSLGLWLPMQAHAMIFVDIPGIPGDATVAGHEGEITVLSLGFSGGQVVRKAGPKLCAPPSNKTQISAMTLQKLSDLASPKLFAAAAEGTVFATVTVSVVTFSGVSILEVARYALRNAFVSSYDVSSDGDRPSESVSLQFERLDLTNFDPTPETTSWNFCDVGP